jgi:hypothetical protein
MDGVDAQQAVANFNNGVVEIGGRRRGVRIPSASMFREGSTSDA